MNPLLLCVAAATLGFQYGWELLPDGRMEYIIQLDPAAIEALRDGQTLRSDIPTAAGEIRAYRIVMGRGRPRQDTPPPKPAPPPAKAALVEPPRPAQSSFPLTLTILGLFASLGANVFLAWIAWGFRRRCQNGVVLPSV
ncbi:MAG: hypothetical protein WCB27_14320 [Thermoguttaceae bacterium]|jgi:hypothetical protein